MKPTLLEAYEKGLRIIDSMTLKSISSSRHYITLFSRMFIYKQQPKDFINNYIYRKSLLRAFDAKLDELCKKKTDENIQQDTPVLFEPMLEPSYNKVYVEIPKGTRIDEANRMLIKAEDSIKELTNHPSRVWGVFNGKTIFAEREEMNI